MRVHLLILGGYLGLLACNPVGSAPTEEAIREQWRVAERRGFDARNFTQGLEIHDGELWVSSGLYGQSAVRRYDLKTGRQLAEKRLARRYFAEGLTKVDHELYLLTWRARQLLILDAESLQIKRSMKIPGEGWGMTHHQTTIWYSDGSDRLMYFDSKQVHPTLASVHVTLDGRPLSNLNELEWVDNEIWANIWQTDDIARIDPRTGRVNAVINLKALYPRTMRPPGADVLNGIARDPESGSVWVTGKRWPFMFSITSEPTR